jgi:hypothetical protein
LANPEAPNAVGHADLDDRLDGLWVEVAPIAADKQRATLQHGALVRQCGKRRLDEVV